MVNNNERAQSVEQTAKKPWAHESLDSPLLTLTIITKTLELAKTGRLEGYDE